jgi:hypothetical protein
MATETLQIVINAKDNASKPIGNVGKSLGGLKSAVGVAAKAAAAGFAAIGVAAVAAGAKAISMGSDVEEMMGKFNVVFGDYAGDVIKDLDAFGAAVGRNKFELREMASSVQDTFVPMGFARGAAANLSTAMTKLAVDVASFNNASDTEVMEAFQSAIVGNHETVRQFGIVITQATLDQELMRMGIEGGIKTATEAQKVQARYNLILAGTSDAHGDAERTAGSWANTMRGLKSSIAETVAEIGTNLLPVFTPMLQGFKELAQEYGPILVEWVEDFVDVLSLLVDYFTFVLDEGDTLNDFFADLPDSIQPIVRFIGEVINALRTLRGAFNLGGIPAIAEQLGQWFQNGIKWFREKIGEFWNSLVTWWDTNGEQLAETARTKISEWASSLAIKIGDAASALWEQFVTWWDEGGKELTEDASTKIGEWVAAIPIEILGWVGEIWGQLKTWWDTEEAATMGTDIGTKIVDVLGSTATPFFSTLGTTWGTALGNAIYSEDGSNIDWSGIANGLITAFSAALGASSAAWDATAGAFWKGFTDALILKAPPLFQGVMRDLQDSMEVALSPLPQKKWEAAQRLADRMIEGVAEGIEDSDGLEDIAGYIQQSVDESVEKSDISKNSAKIGTDIVDGIGSAIEEDETLVEKFLNLLSETITDAAAFLIAKSPSELTAKTLGAPMAEGIAVGFLGLAQDINDAVVLTLQETFLGAEGEIVEFLETVRTSWRTMLGIIRMGMTLIREDLGKHWSAISTSGSAAAHSAGAAMGNGLKAGVLSKAGEIAAAAARVVRNAIAAARAAARSASPSKEMIELGKDLIAGLVVGIDEDEAEAVQALSRTMQSALRVVRDALNLFEDMATFQWPTEPVQPIIEWLAAFAGMALTAIESVRAWSQFETLIGGDGKTFGGAIDVLVDAAKAWEVIQNFKWGSFDYQPVIDWLASFAGMALLAVEWIRGWSQFENVIGGDGKMFGSALDVLVDAAKAWEVIQDFKWGAFDYQPVIRWLASFAGMAADAVKWISEWGQFSGLRDDIIEFQKRVGATLDVIVDAAKAWEVVQNFKWASFDYQPVVAWLASFSGVVATMVLRVSEWGQFSGLKNDMQDFADNVIATFEVMSKAVEFLAELKAFKWVEDLPEKFKKLRQAMEEVVLHVYKMRMKVGDMVSDDLVKFVRAIGELSDGLLSAVRLMTDLSTATLRFDSDLIGGFAGMIEDMIDALREQIEAFDIEKEPLIKAFSEALGSVMGGLKAALEVALMFPEGFTEPDETTWEFFTGWVKRTFKRLESWIKTNWTYDGTNDPFDIVTLFGDALSSIMGGLQTALELALMFPADFKEPNDMTWEFFTGWVKRTFKRLESWINTNWTYDGTNDPFGIVTLFGDALGSLMGGLRAALETALLLPADWSPPSDETWGDFEDWVKNVFDSFKAYLTKELKTDKDGAAVDDPYGIVKSFAEALSPLMSGLGAALNLALAQPANWPVLDMAAWKPFFEWVEDVMDSFIAYVEENYPQTEAEANQFAPVQAFGSAMGAVMGGLSSALDVLGGIVTYIAPLDSQIEAFIAGVKTVMSKITTYAKGDAVQAGNEATTAFATAMSAVFSGLQTALSVFSAVYDKGAGFAGWLAGIALDDGGKLGGAMGDLFTAITATLLAFQNNVQGSFTSQWSPAAEAFATAVGKVFAVLKNALAVFGEIDSQGLPDLETLRAFVQAVLEVFGMFTQGLLDAEESAKSVSDNYVNTVISSLQDGNTKVYAAAYDLGYQIVAGVKYATQSNSPSQEAIWVANNYVDSIVATLQGRTDSVRQAARELGDAMTPAGMSDYDYASAQPALVVRVEGDISLGGQNVDPATANQIAGMLVNQLRIGA